MHDEQNGWIFLFRFGGGPVQRNVPSVFEEYFFPLKVQTELSFDEIIDGLEEGMGEVESGFELEVLFG